jgi:hypothetical protein
VELYERISRDCRDKGLGVRALARRHRVHRRTVREALASATPSERKVAQRSSPALGPYEGIVREWLTADLVAPRKQRATFSDPRLAAAVVDRLTFRAHIIETGTQSYRLAATRSRTRPAKSPEPKGA